jgi:predicted DNA-binding antitoxin AbrB/MazE fold protein
MLHSSWAVVQDGQIELLEPLNVPDGTKVIITILTEDEEDSQFWQDASKSSLDKIWNNDEDDVYAELLDA